MNREEVFATPRKAMTKKRRLEVFNRAGGICQCGCGLKLKPDWEVEHPIMVWLGTEDADDTERLEAWNKECHKRKTKVDAATRGHIQRIIKKSDPLTRKPSRMQSKPFDKPTTKTQWAKRPFPKRIKS